MDFFKWMGSMKAAGLRLREPVGLAAPGDRSGPEVETALAKLDQDQENRLVAELVDLFASFQNDYPALKARGVFQIDLAYAHAVPDAERAQELEEISDALEAELARLIDACEIAEADELLKESALAFAILLMFKPRERNGAADIISMMAYAWGDVADFHASVVPLCLKKLGPIRSGGG